MMVAVGTTSCSSSSRFGPSSTLNVVTPVTLPPGRFEAGDKSVPTGSPPVAKTIGIVVVAALAASAEGVPATRQSRSPDGEPDRPPTPAIDRNRPFRPAIFDRYVLALDIAGFFQALTERTQATSATYQAIGHRGTRPPASPAAARAPRAATPPPRRRAAYELAPPHSITSSVRASSVIGGSKPSALAVFRLITSSNLVGCCTGRSAGFSPFRMRST